MITETSKALEYLATHVRGNLVDLKNNIAISVLNGITSNPELIELKENNYFVKERLIEVYSQKYFPYQKKGFFEKLLFGNFFKNNYAKQKKGLKFNKEVDWNSKRIEKNFEKIRRLNEKTSESSKPDYSKMH